MTVFDDFLKFDKIPTINDKAKLKEKFSKIINNTFLSLSSK